MRAAFYRPLLEMALGLKLKRCRMGAGSMRGYIQISFDAPFEFTGDHSADQLARHKWIAERVGFAPFYTSREYMSTGDFCACLSIGAINYTETPRGAYSETPHKSLNEIEAMAEARLKAGECPYFVRQDLVNGYSFGFQSANDAVIQEACLRGLAAREMEVSS